MDPKSTQDMIQNNDTVSDALKRESDCENACTRLHGMKLTSSSCLDWLVARKAPSAAVAATNAVVNCKYETFIVVAVTLFVVCR